ncbi:hypothetical protein RT717_15775 [Imperialibacter roseus]|uniref:Uncharacterized protein n=1 Tax=Imperialibacter roseus TaxID=1324217 RepID=A0ABZ0IKM2_9BACT|nr:hypothetical protein [Imperialibacter roseus]WOK04540.1 hypothetical protein RT717_15775 [Imperialibacter roseus]
MNNHNDALNRFMRYESAINRRFQDGIPTEFNSELKLLFSENTDGYSFYRNKLYYELKRIKNEHHLIDDFHKLISTTKKLYPEKFKYLFNKISNDELLDEYDVSRFNMIEICDELKTLEKITQQSCFLYQSIYEINTLYIVLGSISELRKNGNINFTLDNLRDRAGHLKKGTTIDYIASRISDLPHLFNSFTKTFHSKLRNTIGHNSYVRKDQEICSRDGQTKVSRNEFIEALYNFQEMDNALINALSSEGLLDSCSELAKCGLLAIAFAGRHNKKVLVVFQLWCFYDLRKDQPWLKEVTFKLSSEDVETTLGASLNQKGKNSKTLRCWFKELNEQDPLKVEIITIPVTPVYQSGDEVLTLDAGKFKELESQKTKSVGYQIERAL